MRALTKEKYEVYSVPNQELDGTETYLTGSDTLEYAQWFADDFREMNGEPVWVILASDKDGYIKVVST